MVELEQIEEMEKEIIEKEDAIIKREVDIQNTLSVMDGKLDTLLLHQNIDPKTNTKSKKSKKAKQGNGALFHRDLLLDEMSDTVENMPDTDEANERDVAVMIEEVDAIKAKVESIEGKVKSMEDKVGSIEVQVKSIEGKVKSMDGKIESIEGKVDKMETSMEEIKDMLSQLMMREVADA